MEMKRVKIFNRSVFNNPFYETGGSAGVDLKADFSKLHSNSYEADLVYYGSEGIGVDFDINRTLVNENNSHGYGIKSLVLPSGVRVVLPTNIYIQLPEGYEFQIRPRSGLSLKKGLQIINSPGTVDEDYTGEIGIIVFNPTDKEIKIEHGDRVAQGILSKYEKIEWENVEVLGNTERGSGGFGSTGN